MKPPDWLTPERAMGAMMILFAIQVLTGAWRAKREARKRQEAWKALQAKAEAQRSGRWTAADMPTRDPIAAETMARALNTGGIVFANRREDGSVEYSEDDTPERTETP